MEELVKVLKEKSKTIASCESLTGGLFASSIVDVSGASSVLVGSYVTYMDKCKETLLDGKEVLDSVGAISKEMAYLMAYKVKEKLGSNIAVSFTGNAGPTVCEGDKEVGLIYISIYFEKNFYTEEYHLNIDRNAIRETAVDIALKNILKILEKNLKNPHLCI